MFTSLVRRTSVVAIAVVAATSLVSGGTAVSAGPHATSIAIRAAHQAVKPGASNLISGSIRVGGGQALPGKTVTLEAKLPGESAFVPIGTDVSGPRGGVALTVTPAETTRYRWVFAGDASNRASRSGVVTVKVRQPAHPPRRLGTSLSIRAASPVVNLAGNSAINGRLTAHRKALRGKVVVLLSRTTGSSTWAFAKAKRTGRNGGVAFVIHPSATAHYKLVFQGTPNFRPARSGVVRVAVRSTALTIATSATSVPAGGSATVSGVLTKSGTAYPGQAVQLWGKPAGTNQAFAALQGATTGEDGTVAFTVTPSRTMRYFLFFPRTADAPAARSATRTMAVS